MTPSLSLFFIVMCESGVVRLSFATEHAIHLGIIALETLVVGCILRRTNSPFSSEPRDCSGLASIESIR